jgi:hypothetical protein
MPSGDEPALPDMVGHYHTLYPLEDLAAAEESPSAALGVRTCAIKGVNSHDGQAYALRRVDGKQVGFVSCASALPTSSHALCNALAHATNSTHNQVQPNQTNP